MGYVKDRLGFVEQNLQTLNDHVLEELESLKKVVMGQDELRTRFMELVTNLQEQLDVVKVGVEETRQEMTMCKRAIAGGAVVTHSPRVDAPKPKEFGGKRDAKELDNFIWHMKGYSAKAAPLTNLLKKGKAWEWSKRCQTAFEGLKEGVTEELVLALSDHTKVFELQTDASDFAIGGVLMQEGHPIAFESHKLNDTERRYTVQEKEMTAGATEGYSERPRPKVYGEVLDGVVQTPWLRAALFNELSPPNSWTDGTGDYKGRSLLATQVARSWNEQADVACSYLDKAACKMKKWRTRDGGQRSTTLGTW
ncbi:hypothetical protein RJ639_041395 [Escallonia herrerae]|uniref:Reverse transcriptase/retrotransposon-derived protein RNase H-like domain-containing protein n=1 Tax=Escallonia herrerae TaxID=1293975 RepID=A0AA88WLD5_9ASTE|nr:hypothetical protein RJ639_041395 [Escallonia herrerae]